MISFGAEREITKGLFFDADYVHSIHFFEKPYRPTSMSVSDLIRPLRLDEIRRARMSSLSKGERKRLLLALGLLTPGTPHARAATLFAKSCSAS